MEKNKKINQDVVEETPKEESLVEEVVKETPKEEPKKEYNPEDIKTLLEKFKELEKKNEMLIEVADKKALANYYSKNQKKVPKEIKLNLIDGRVITSWAMTKNEVYKDSTTQRWIERQEISLSLEDGQTLEMAYTDFTRKYTQVPAVVVSTSKDEETDKLMLKVNRLDNGKEYSIDVEFIN